MLRGYHTLLAIPKKFASSCLSTKVLTNIWGKKDGGVVGGAMGPDGNLLIILLKVA